MSVNLQKNLKLSKDNSATLSPKHLLGGGGIGNTQKAEQFYFMKNPSLQTENKVLIS